MKVLLNIQIKTISTIALLCFANSCARPRYQIIHETPKALDFNQGKWLINNIEADLSWTSQNILNENLYNKMNEFLNDSVYHVDSISLDYIVPEKLKFDISSETLDLLKKTTKFNFLINTRAIEKRDDFGTILFDPPEYYGINQAEVIIKVYDLQNGKEIYQQRIISTIKLDKKDENIMHI